MNSVSTDIETGFNESKDLSTEFMRSVTTISLDGGTATKKTLSRAFLSFGMPVTFKDVSYSVTHRKKNLGSITILNSVSGYFKPGEMAALMGPSGSGKSTLLDILAGRKTVGTISGEIKIGGEKPTRTFLRRYTGYVEQSDTLLDILTVEEMLMYTAELKRSESEPESSKKAAVQEILEVLALDSCRDVLIGSPLARGISGGQAKRVNIGIALITSPRILFLDEPTSGLDSFTANEVMTVVKGLCFSGITVCATIHSPTPYCFSLFDRLLLLLRGEMAYFGKSGIPACEYFESIVPQASKRKEEDNEAEWIVDLTTQADRQNKAGEFAAVFSKSQQKVDFDFEINNQLSSASELDEDARRELAVKRETATSSWHGLKTLIKYRTTKNYRNPAFLGPRLGDKFIFSILFLTVYWGIGADLVADNVVNVAGMLLMWVILPAFGAASYIPAIVLERPLFVRERNDGLYRVITYLCAKTIEELGIAFLASLIFSNVVFWAIDFHGEYVIFWLLYLVTLATGIMVAYFVAAMSPNIDVANAALPAYITTLIFFSGLLIRWSQIPVWWSWYRYINFLGYAWGALMINEYGDGRDIPFLYDSEVNETLSVLEYFSLDGVTTCLCCPPPPSLAASGKKLPSLEQQWEYGNPEGISQWTAICKTGKSQSPIDIPLPEESSTSFNNAPTASNTTSSSSSLGTLLFRYPTFVKKGATVCNNSHGSPQINFPPGFDVVLGENTYSLLQLHFHTPSEHSFSGGQHFPIECHLVHRDNTTKELLVVAVTMKIGAANPILHAGLSSCPNFSKIDAPIKSTLSLRSILPPPRGMTSSSGGRRYATYEGSLTTPPCTENVRWVVLLDHVTVSAQQVLDLMAVGSGGKDWEQTQRPLQPLNKRKIEYSL